MTKLSWRHSEHLRCVAIARGKAEEARAALEREARLALEQGCTAFDVANALGISRSSLYRLMAGDEPSARPSAPLAGPDGHQIGEGDRHALDGEAKGG